MDVNSPDFKLGSKLGSALGKSQLYDETRAAVEDGLITTIEEWLEWRRPKTLGEWAEWRDRNPKLSTRSAPS